MHFGVIGRIIGTLLMLFSVTLLVPVLVSLIYQDGAWKSFVASFVFSFAAGGVLWGLTRKRRAELAIRDGFLIVSLFWIVLGLFGALPFALDDTLKLSGSDAIFESISGLTTTGATVITGLDSLPHAILFYRQMLQWLGGIGIIVIAVAILPILGIGGMQLYRAETPGPVKDSKLTPRITGTAKALFGVYVTLTALCALFYWLAGMSGFDAICHAFSTVAIGGFSTHDASMGFFDSPAILMISSLFMLLAGINFALHFAAWRSRRLSSYLSDSEARFYLYCIVISCVVCVGFLILTDTFGSGEAIIEGVFQTVSMATTTGFSTSNFSAWPSFLPVFLVLLSFMGGCAGSTGGGLKVVRVMLMVKQGVREMKQLVHPSAIIPLKVGNRRVEAKVVSAVWSFFAVYMMSFIVILLSLMITNLDYLSAFSATTATLNNLGPGLGSVAAHYGDISDPSKWILCFAMLLGRLEVFTLFVLFTPAFWRS